jgi:hypothetical protein
MKSKDGSYEVVVLIADQVQQEYEKDDRTYVVCVWPCARGCVCVCVRVSVCTDKVLGGRRPSWTRR